MIDALKLLPHGHILKNSSKPINGFKYDHPLDGHGFLNKITITDDGFHYRGIRQQTYHYKRERDANKQIFRGLGTNSSEPFGNIFINNFNNVSVCKYENSIFSLGEGGVPYEIDIDSGETIGPMAFKGIADFILERLPYFPMSAHPQFIEGDMYNMSCFNYGVSIMKNNSVVFLKLFPKDTFYAHDFKVTESFFVIYLNRINLSFADAYLRNKTILSSIEFIKGNRVLLIDRITLKHHWIKLDENVGGAMHIAAAIESKSQFPIKSKSELKLYLCLSNEMSLSNVQEPYNFEGFYLNELNFDLSDMSNITYSKTKLLNLHAEMPVHVNDNIFLINENELISYDFTLKTCKIYRFEPGHILEEPCVVDQVIYQIAHINETRSTCIYCINKNNFNLIYKHTFPFNIPFGFHGLFVESN